MNSTIAMKEKRHDFDDSLLSHWEEIPNLRLSYIERKSRSQDNIGGPPGSTMAGSKYLNHRDWLDGRENQRNGDGCDRKLTE
jgi:hypothetical protein